jgi:hypothetical protein
MAIEEVVRKVLVDEHADVLRESVTWLARQLMEVEVSELIGSRRRVIRVGRLSIGRRTRVHAGTVA